MDISKLTSDQQQRLVDHFWRFEDVDVSDVHDSVRSQFYRELAKGKTVQQIMGLPVIAVPPKPVSIGSRIPALIRGAAVAIASVVVLLGSFMLIKNVHAERTRQAQNRDFANSMTSVLLQVYEENPIRTASLLDLFDQNLPIHSYEDERPDESKIQACRVAVRSLLASRLGHPSERAKLEGAMLMFQNGTSSEVDMLDFLFLLTVGKAALESNDLQSQRVAVQGTKSVQFSTFVDALESAREMLDSGPTGDFSEDDKAVLSACLTTDIARATLRYGKMPIGERSNVALQKLRIARQKLEQVEHRRGSYYLAKARELNNRLLVWHRRQQSGELDAKTVANFLRGASEEIENFSIEIDSLENPLVFAINFERALCHSNLADMLLYEIKDGDSIQSNNVVKGDQHRDSAVSLLSSIAHSARTQRCHENHFINRVRPIVKRAVFFQEQAKSEVVTTKASALDAEAGGIFNTEIGQFGMAHRLAVASLLTEKYSDTTILNYARELQVDLGKMQSKKNSWLSHYRKWLEKLILRRQSSNEKKEA